MTSATPRTFLYQSAKRVLDALQSGHNPTFEEIDKLSAAIQEYENGNEQSESSALSQAQQALRRRAERACMFWVRDKSVSEFNYGRMEFREEDVERTMKKWLAEAALPSDTPGAQAQEAK